MTWDGHLTAWSHPPVDDVGYLSSAELLQRPDDELRQLINNMHETRYHGERNHENRWRDVMGLDQLRGQRVLDFGCGVGLEALELARGGNQVALADIVEDNVRLAERVLRLFGHEPSATYVITDKWPLIDAPADSLDVFYCNGVLHHCRWPRDVIERAHELLTDDGEARLLLYSDVGWRIATGTEPPRGDVEQDPNFTRFVRHFDSVGDYADWYDYDRINERFGDLFEIQRCAYLTATDQYLGVRLTKTRPW